MPVWMPAAHLTTPPDAALAQMRAIFRLLPFGPRFLFGCCCLGCLPWLSADLTYPLSDCSSVGVFFMTEHSSPLDAFIILGSRLNAQGRPGRIGRMRLEHALAVWQEQGGDAYMIITGGPTHGTHVTEAQAMAAYALAWAENSWGPETRDRLADRLILEKESKNTLASARHTLPVIQGLNLTSVALVSDGLHIRRARYLFRRHFRHHRIDLHSLPVPGVMRTYWQNRRYFWLTKMALREGAAWLKVLGHRALFWR
jgi:hypothetical protein